MMSKVKVPFIIPVEENKIKIAMDKIGFLSDIISDLANEVRGSKYDAQKLKYHLNGVQKEAEKRVTEHYNLYESSPSGAIVEGLTGLDVYAELVKAYSFIFSKAPHEVLSIAKVIEILEQKGIKYTEVCFEPTKILD